MPRLPRFLDQDGSNFKPKLSFVGRNDILNRFIDLYSTPQSKDEHRILNIYGIGGQGKTALAEQFSQHLKTEREKHGGYITWATLNFEIETYRRDPALALLSIRHQLRKQGIVFPAFDTAFARHFMLTQQGRDIETTHPELFHQEIEILSDMEGVGGDILESIGGVVGDVVADIPGVGTISKNLGKLSGKLKRWWKRRGVDVLRGLDLLEAHKITERLPIYLAADLYEWLSEPDYPKRRLTLIFDTYEALWRDRANKVGDMAVRVDEWVEGLMSDAIGVYVVILGREALGWAQQDAGWEPHIQSWRLNELEPNDAEALLLAVPVAEAEIRTAMLVSSERVAFYLKLHIDRYAEFKNRQQLPVVNDFTEPQTEIVARFTDHMEAGLRQALKVSSCPRFLDEALFLGLAEAFLGGVAAVSFRDLLHYSFWEKPEADMDGEPARYRLHNVMREQLQIALERDEVVLFKRVHEHSFALYDDVFDQVSAIEQAVKDKHGIEREHDDYSRFEELLTPYEVERQALFLRFDDALREGLYHLKRVDDKRLVQWLNTRDARHRKLAAWTKLRPLWEYALQFSELNLGTEHPDTATSLNNLALLYKNQGNYNAAEPLYQRALRIRERQFGSDPITAMSLNNLAELCRAQGNYDLAKSLHQRALNIRESQLEAQHPDIAMSLSNLAELHRMLGNYSVAEPLSQRALSIYESQFGSDHPKTAMSLNNLATLYNAQDDFRAAKPLYQRALNICELQLGPDHPNTATSLNNLALLHYAQGNYSSAEPLYQRALNINESQLGKEHPNTAINLDNLAVLYRAQNNYSAAASLHKRALSIYELQLGSEHPTTALSLNNLAGLYHAQGNYSASKPLYQRAIKILTSLLGEDHPNTKQVKSNYETMKAAALGDFS